LKKFFYAVLLFCIIISAVQVPLKAAADTVPYFTYSLSVESAASGDMVKLKINANQTADTAAGFRMMINYDDKLLSFVCTETSSQIKSGTLVTNSTGNPIYSVYVCNVGGTAAPELSGNIITFVFKVKDAAAEGKTSIGAHIDEVCNYQATQLNLNYDEDLLLAIDQPDEISDEAYLNELEPADGKLKPEFSSDVFEYVMKVDYDVNSVEFAASAGDNGTVKINRKSLGKAGTKTDVVVTVTSEDKKVKSEYVVTVSRAAAPVIAAVNSGEVKGNSEGTRTAEEQTKAKEQKQAQEKAKNTAQGKSIGSNVKQAASATAEEPTGNEDAAVVTEAAAAQTQPVYTDRSDRNLYVSGSQMPVYVVGMLAAALCIMIGIALSLWLKINSKKSATAEPPKAVAVEPPKTMVAEPSKAVVAELQKQVAVKLQNEVAESQKQIANELQTQASEFKKQTDPPPFLFKL
jgi:hypothetical protein